MRFEPMIPQEMFRQLERMGKVEDLAPRMLAAGAVPVVESIKKHAATHRRTGALAGSVRAGKATLSKRTGGYALPIRFWGYDKARRATPCYPRGVPNAVKAAGIEFGNAHQAAEPFMQAAAAEAEDAATAAMQQVFEKEAVP